RFDGLLDELRPGRPREIGDDEIAETIRLTLETTPRGATHWSLRSMAQAVGHAPSTVHRIWQAFGLQPHRIETFKLSTDPLFVEKVGEIVGLYMTPPERVLVFCVDEKSQIQALDRPQPVLPMRPGQAERRSHDYTRHGTLSLFAALDVATGKVIGKCFARHRGREFLRACSGLIESGGFPLGNRCASLSALIRLWEAVDGEGIFRGYAPAGYRAGGKWCFTAGGSGTLRSEPQHGGDLGEVLSRDRPMCRQTAWWEHIAAGKTWGL